MALQDREPRQISRRRISARDAIGVALGVSFLATFGGVVFEATRPIPPKILLYDGSAACGPEGPQLQIDRADTKGQLIVVHQEYNSPVDSADGIWATDVQVLRIDTTGPEPIVFVGVGGEPGVGVIPTASPKGAPQSGQTQLMTGVEFAFKTTADKIVNLKVGERLSTAFNFTTDPGASEAQMQAADNNLKAYQDLAANATQGCRNPVLFESPAFVITT